MPELSPAFFFVLRKKLREGCMLCSGSFVCTKKKVKKMLLPGSAFLFVSNSDKR